MHADQAATLRFISPELPRIDAEPYYRPTGGEVGLFEAAYRHRLSVLLKGPTGCGKTRFVETMAAAALRGDRLRLPDAVSEAAIVAAEGGVDAVTAERLVKLGELTRNLKGAGLDEGASTRLLVHAAHLIADGVEPLTACTGAVARALCNDAEMNQALDDLVRAVF